MSGFDAIGLRNRRAIPLAQIPDEVVGAFRHSVIDAVRRNWRIVAGRFSLSFFPACHSASLSASSPAEA